MKVWITKYALTAGVFIVDGTAHADSKTRMVSYTRVGHHKEYAHGRQWHTSYADAADQVAEMKAAKIKSLQKQLAKLEAMTIEVPE